MNPVEYKEQLLNLEQLQFLEKVFAEADNALRQRHTTCFKVCNMPRCNLAEEQELKHRICNYFNTLNWVVEIRDTYGFLWKTKNLKIELYTPEEYAEMLFRRRVEADC
jgi:hypothetical protein